MTKQKNSTLKRLLQAKSLTLVIVLAVVVLFFYFWKNSYLTGDNIRNIMNNTTLSGTLTVGIACILISGNADLSAGAVGTLGGILITYILKAGIGWVPALLIVVAFGVCAGLINALLVNVFNFMSFIGTLAMASVWRGLCSVLTNNENQAVVNKSFWEVGTIRILDIPLPFIIMLALFVIYGIILSSTRFGRSIYMCGGNRNAARLAGINPKRISTILFANCGGIAAFGGAILAARMHSASVTAVIGKEMDGITAAVLGGIAFTGGSGDMVGCFIGLLLLNCFNNGLSFIGLGTYWQMIASGLLLILALTVDYFRERSRKRNLEKLAEEAN